MIAQVLSRAYWLWWCLSHPPPLFCSKSFLFFTWQYLPHLQFFSFYLQLWSHLLYIWKPTILVIYWFIQKKENKEAKPLQEYGKKRVRNQEEIRAQFVQKDVALQVGSVAHYSSSIQAMPSRIATTCSLVSWHFAFRTASSLVNTLHFTRSEARSRPSMIPRQCFGEGAYHVRHRGLQQLEGFWGRMEFS